MRAKKKARNEGRPGYKKTKVGWIPEEWGCVRLIDLVVLQRGFDLPESKRIEGKIPVYASNGLVGWHNESRVKGPGIVTGRSGSVGKVTYIVRDFWPLNTTLYVKDFKGNDPLFAYYFLNHLRIERFSNGTGVPTLNRNDVHPYRIPLPPIPEQKKIAEILSAWDRAIEQVGRLIDAKERFKKGLMQKLLTGRMRFAGFGKPVEKKGELPEGWLKKHFSTIFKRVNLKRFQISKKDYKESGKYPVVDQGQEKIVAWSNAEPITDPLPVIIFGDHTREIKWIDFPFIPGADGTIILISADETSTVFAYFLLCNTQIVSLGYSRHFSELKSKKFLVPQIPEQIRIAAVLSSCDREIELLKKKLEKLKEQKKGLMQKLLTGEIRHPDFTNNKYKIEDKCQQ